MPASFSFLHLADLHLDSQLHGLGKYEGAPRDQLRLATRHAFENAISLALTRKVDFVVVAGDVYDGNWMDFNTGLFFNRQASRLREAGIPLVAIAGNHDAANRMTLRLSPPDNVRYLSSQRPETIRLDDLGVAIHGQSFATAAVHDDLSAAYPAAIQGDFNIGLLHTCASGRAGHERYAPCTLEGLKAKGYDYWALGHIHTREVLSTDPHIIFPGNTQGRHIRETGPKGCLLVEIGPSRDVSYQFHALDVVRWQLVEVDLGPTAAPDCQSIEDVLGLVADGLTAALASAEQRLLAVRVRLHGATELHSRLLADHPQLTNEIRSQATTVGGSGIWIEKVVVETRPRKSTPIAVDGPLGEIAAIAEEWRSEELLSIPDEIEEMLRKLPTETIDADLFRTPEGRASLLAEAEALVTHLLLGKDDPT